MSDFVCVCVCLCLCGDVILSFPSDITALGNHDLITPLSYSLFLSLSSSPPVSREITVLRQLPGVPADAHIVGQRFHCHQVGGVQSFLRTLCVCVCVCACVRVCLV